MESTEVFERVVRILAPYAQDGNALDRATLQMHLLDELKVNSAMLVDIVIDIENEFDIEIADEQADSVATVGDVVEVVSRSLPAASAGPLRVA